MAVGTHLVESINVNVIHGDDKVRIRNKSDCRMYNYNQKIMEGGCNCGRDLVLGRRRDL
jgi:hypothetical protein